MKCPKCGTMILESSNNYHGKGIVYGVFCAKCRAFVSLKTNGEVEIIHIRNRCPVCGNCEHYRIIYKDDEMTEIDYYDCMICHTHWDKEGNNLGRF